MTDVGAYTTKPSDSPYGTFDQAGNVWECNEAIMWTSSRGLRGGSFSYSDDGLPAASRYGCDPTFESYWTGFRVSEVPEPSFAVLLLLGFWGVRGRRRMGRVM